MSTRFGAGGQLCEGEADVEELERELVGLAGVAELLVMGLTGDREPLVVVGFPGVELEDEVGFVGVELSWLVVESDEAVIEMLGELVGLLGVEFVAELEVNFDAVSG